MIEIRGITEYETFSHGSGRSRKGGEKEGAEFSELLHVGEEGKTDGSVLVKRMETERGAGPVSGMEFVTYDISGNRFLSGMHVGRNLDVEL